jgi:uncharacterized membrane protein HdeD (DUF308 family)
MSAIDDEARQYERWVAVALLVLGLLTLGVGLFLVIEPHETLKVFTIIIGVLLLVDGVIAVIASIAGRGEGRVLLAIVGVISVLAGLVLIKKPFQAIYLLADIVGIWLIVVGVARFMFAFSAVSGRGGQILVSLVDVAAGTVILVWPKATLTTLAVIIGIVMIIRGILLMYAGWVLRRSAREGGDDAVAVAVG